MGPRSLIRTTTESPVASLITLMVALVGGSPSTCTSQEAGDVTGACTTAGSTVVTIEMGGIFAMGGMVNVLSTVAALIRASLAACSAGGGVPMTPGEVAASYE